MLLHSFLLQTSVTFELYHVNDLHDAIIDFRVQSSQLPHTEFARSAVSVRFVSGFWFLVLPVAMSTLYDFLVTEWVL